MEDRNQNNHPLGDLFSSNKCYIDHRSDEIKLALAENLANIFSRIIFLRVSSPDSGAKRMATAAPTRTPPRKENKLSLFITQ